MKNSLKTGLVAGAAIVAVMAAMPVQALEVKEVGLSYAASEKIDCPRTITMGVWANTDGPGVVRFVIRKAGGGKSDQIAAQVVKLPSGYRALHTQVFKIPANTDTQYMAEALGHGKISAWMPLKETCGPQVRTQTRTTGVTPKPGRHISERDENPKPSGGKPLPSGDSKPLPSGGGKPIPGAGDEKPILCKSTVTAKRVAAVTRAGGVASAWVAWSVGVEKLHGVQFSSVFDAKEKKSSCTGAVVYSCTVSARPCRS
jgi:hypothetical protein